MRVTCASKLLKQPIEFDIPDEEYERIKKIKSTKEQNDSIYSLAIKHIKKYGYDFGFCKETNRNVNFNSCIDCGVKQGQSHSQWESCKTKNINYKYVSSKTTTKAIKEIKDEKIRSKLELTPQELEAAKHLYIIDK